MIDYELLLHHAFSFIDLVWLLIVLVSVHSKSFDRRYSWMPAELINGLKYMHSYTFDFLNQTLQIGSPTQYDLTTQYP